MIAVVGRPRSGTSKIMQFLKGGGYSLKGEFLPPGFDPTWHPGGVWECDETTKGVFAPIEEDCIKLMPKSLMRSTYLPKKIILCTRDFGEMTKSQMRSQTLNWLNFETGVESNELVYHHLIEWIENKGIPFITVSHEDYLVDRVAGEDRIRGFLNG